MWCHSDHNMCHICKNLQGIVLHCHQERKLSLAVAKRNEADRAAVAEAHAMAESFRVKHEVRSRSLMYMCIADQFPS